ncbi:caspase domain-containing protein [Kitasatospora sp. NPDC048365]|uniref:caspase family protein n=1 Tax=Kitasatospora sp. NPDC048365 TaxID=3364050 RepID=UPI00371FD4C7
MTVLADPGRSAAVLIGVHDFVHLDALPAVEENLLGLRRVLTDPAVWGLSDEACAVISQPTAAREVLNAVREKAREATDTLLVYYAGHGVTDDYSEELYLALPDTDREDAALRFEFLRRAVDSSSRARRRVVILDCCYSGRAMVGAMGAAQQFADLAEVEGTVVLTASAATRPALAPPGERYTAFTGELIDVLERGLADGPRLLDMETLYRCLHTRLGAKSRPLPQQRNRNTGGLIAIARNRAAAESEDAGREREAEREEWRRAAEENLARKVREAEQLWSDTEARARELMHRATRLSAAVIAPADAAFVPYRFTAPDARRLFGTDGSLEPVAELVPGKRYLAAEARGDALLVEIEDGTRLVLLDRAGIRTEEERNESGPFWFAVPVKRQLASVERPSEYVGELLTGTWYLAVETRGESLVVQLPDGGRGLLNDTRGIQRGTDDGPGELPEGLDRFRPFWFAVSEPHDLTKEDGSPERVGELVPGKWYLALEDRGDALLALLPDGTCGVLLQDTRSIQKDTDPSPAEWPVERDEFELFWFAVPVKRSLVDQDRPSQEVAELQPGTWYLAVAARGDSLVVQVQDGSWGVLHDTSGIQRG